MKLIDKNWEPPLYGYTEVFCERWSKPEDEYLVNRIGRYMGDSHTVVCCPTREAAEAARRLLMVDTK